MFNSISLPKIIFSQSLVSDLRKIIVKKKCVLLTSSYWKTTKVYRDIINQLKPVEIINDIAPNPDLDKILEKKIDFSGVEYCISLGGGSVIDYTKALIAFYNCEYNKGYFKKILISNKKFSKKNIDLPKFIAVPTTSGTGSEINSWGTVWQKNQKLSVSGDILKPNYALMNASLCKTMTLQLTVSSALDAFSHALESIWNKNHTYISDEIAVIAVKKIITFLPLVIKHSTNIEYRKELQLASLLAGISMSQTQTALCHSISYPLTSIYNIPHGIACSLTLSEVARLNSRYHKKRMSIIANALSCKNSNISRAIKEFLISIQFKEIFKPYSGLTIDKKINFINPARAKNNLTKITNKSAFDIVKKSIKQYS